VVPWTRASNIARPEAPRMLVATEASLTPASSSTVWRAVGFPRPLLNQDLPIAGEISQLPNRRRGHEASPHEPMLQQLRDPDAVPHIGLPARKLRDVGGVQEQTGKASSST